MKKSVLFNVCPTTGRVTGIKRPEQVPAILFPLVGFLALTWFLLRVVPKPSRATYPCQRVAAPLAGSFLAWLGVTGLAALALGQARTWMRRARWAGAALGLLVVVGWIGWTVLRQPGESLAAGLDLSGLPAPVRSALAAYTPHPANSPLGTAKGLAPGRVAWAHDPLVTDWNGTGTSDGQRWYQHVDQAEAKKMMQWAVLGYAGKATTAEAWDAIFRSFNGGAGYQAGEKIFIKINFTTSNADACADSSYNWNPSSCGASWTSVGNSPQMVIALLDQLVNVVGVAQADISIGDATGLWVNELYTPVHTAFPNIVYLDARGGMGRTAGSRSTTPFYWSTAEADGKTQDYLPAAIVNAKYLIDLAIMKSHERAGITGVAKNHYGTLSGGNSAMRKPTTSGYYSLHARLPLESQDAARWKDRALMGQYRPLVDLLGHNQTGGKTFLYLLDAVYTGKGWAGVPSKWQVAPFCTQPGCPDGTAGWPSSLFLSMDPVAIDSVAFDFLSLKTAWTEVLQAEGVQDYLHEAAQADNPPSGTVYDPEREGQPMTSLGAHEHWNSAALKQYTRNLGTGAGIDLVYLPGDPSVEAAVRKTDEAIEINGEVPGSFERATVQPLGHKLLGAETISGESDLSANFKALWDAGAAAGSGNLYLLVNVTDDHLTNDSATWTDDDSVTVLIDGDDSRGASYDGANDFELGFRWNDATIHPGANSADVPAGTTFSMVATDSGYRLLVKLPLAGLGIAAGYGRPFGLDVQVNDDDDDGGARDAKIAWWATADTSSTRPDAFGTGRLEGPERVTVTAAVGESGVTLKWAHFAWNQRYEVHRGGSPYFTPDEETEVTEVAAPGSQYTDGTAGTAFWVVRANVNELGTNSNRVGRFDYAVVEGEGQ